MEAQDNMFISTKETKFHRHCNVVHRARDTVTFVEDCGKGDVYTYNWDRINKMEKDRGELNE